MNTFAEGFASDGVQVVEVDNTIGWYAIGRGEPQFRHQAALGAGERRHHHRADSVDDRVAGEHQDRVVARSRRRHGRVP